MTDSDYDDFAEAYARQNETGLFNAYYEKPAMLALPGTYLDDDPRCGLWVRTDNGQAYVRRAQRWPASTEAPG